MVGSFNVDHVWRCASRPAQGATLAGVYASGPGGKGFNQAMAASRAGAATTFLCALGDDPGSAMAHALAAEAGIDLRAAPTIERTGTAGIFVDAHGNNSIVVGAGANAALGAAFIDAQRARIEAAAVVLVQLESPLAAVERALALARGAGATTILNPAPANAETTPSLLALADALTPNETEFAALAARHLDVAIDPRAVAATTDETLHALCRRLAPGGTVVITLGAEGCFVSHSECRLRGDATASFRIAAEPATPVDTTGAGDAFNGALAAAMAAGGTDFAAQAGFAGRYAALSTEAPGAALAMPLRAAVEARFPA